MKKLLKIAIVTVSVVLFLLLTVTGINLYVTLSTSSRIYDAPDGVTDTSYDCIIVLGAGVREDRPSDVLADRLLTAIELYNRGVAPKLIMSGDHGSEDYDEVNVMKSFAISHGVPSEDIFMDHAGFSTYDTVYRARAIFGIERAVIVSQKYHLNRALHIGDRLGMEAVGVSADLREYRGETYLGVREALARCKDFFKCIIKPLPRYMGEAIPISGNGNVTNDKTEEI